MKIKQWLREYKNISYADYKAMPQDKRIDLQAEHREFCQKKQNHDVQGCRPMTEEEKRELALELEKEKKRYETSLKIGGIDERGNYTALHHR